MSKSTAEKSYKLTYFDSRGYAEISRLLFALAGQKYEDKRFTSEEWPEIKEKESPYGQAPFLEVGDEKIGQSMAISNYLAREFDLYGSNHLEMAKVDTVLGFRMDIFQCLIKWYYEKDEEKKAKAEDEMYDEKLPVYLAAFEKMLKDNAKNHTSGFFVGNKIGYADLAVFDVLDAKFKDERLNPLLAKFERLVANRKLVEENEKLKPYLASRKPQKIN